MGLGEMEKGFLKTAYSVWLYRQKDSLPEIAQNNPEAIILYREAMSKETLCQKIVTEKFRRNPFADQIDAGKMYHYYTQNAEKIVESLIAKGLLEPFHVHPFYGVKLTDEGRKVGRRLYLRQELLKDKMFAEVVRDALKETLVAMAEERAMKGGPDYATLEEISESLWPRVAELFGAGEAFAGDKELYNLWVEEKIHEELRAIGCKRYQRRRKGIRIWHYDLASVAGFSPQKMALKDTLTYIRAIEGFGLIRVSDITRTLWKIYGKHFKSQEEFERCWNRKTIGVLMKGFGYRRKRKRSRDWGPKKYDLDWVYNIYAIRRDPSIVPEHIRGVTPIWML